MTDGLLRVNIIKHKILCFFKHIQFTTFGK